MQRDACRIQFRDSLATMGCAYWTFRIAGDAISRQQTVRVFGRRMIVYRATDVVAPIGSVVAEMLANPRDRAPESRLFKVLMEI